MASMPAVAVDMSPDQFAMFETDVATAANMNNEVHDQDLVEARIAALGYLRDSRSVTGHHGRDTYYLVGNASRRLIWSRWDDPQQGDVLSFECHDGLDWRNLWQGSICGFLSGGPAIELISPVKPDIRQIGMVMNELRNARADTFCQWTGNCDQNPAQNMQLAVSSLDPEIDGRILRVNRTTKRCHLIDDGKFVHGMSLAEFFTKENAVKTADDFKSFLKTPSRASSGKTIATVWKSLRDAVATFLTRR